MVSLVTRVGLWTLPDWDTDFPPFYPRAQGGLGRLDWATPVRWIDGVGECKRGPAVSTAWASLV